MATKTKRSELTAIDLVITRYLPDGTSVEVKASLSPDYGFSQWGQPTAILGDNVEVLEAIEAAVGEFWKEDGR